MKMFTWAIVLVVCAVPTGCTQDLAWPAVLRAIEAQYPTVEQVSTDSLAHMLSSEAPPLLLDVRTVDEFAVSHLAGAVRIDPDLADLSPLDTLDRSRSIVAYCSVGYRSSALAARLQDAGFTSISNLRGSIFRWANEGRPVVRDGDVVREVHPFDAVWGRLLDEERRSR